jgi:hypothetical protein
MRDPAVVLIMPSERAQCEELSLRWWITWCMLDCLTSCTGRRPGQLCPAASAAVNQETGMPQVGSVFEYVNQNAVFDVIYPDNPLWAPILGVFVFTGFPMAGALGFHSKHPCLLSAPCHRSFRASLQFIVEPVNL